MNLRPCEIEEIGGWYKKSKNQMILDKFVEGDFSCAEVTNYTHKNVRAAQVSFCNSIRKFKYANVHVVVRGEKVYLVKG